MLSSRCPSSTPIQTRVWEGMTNTPTNPSSCVQDQLSQAAHWAALRDPFSRVYSSCGSQLNHHHLKTNIKKDHWQADKIGRTTNHPGVGYRMSASYTSLTDWQVKHLESWRACRLAWVTPCFSCTTATRLLNIILKMKCGTYKVLWSRANLETLLSHFYQILNINCTHHFGSQQSVVLLIHWQ